MMTTVGEYQVKLSQIARSSESISIDSRSTWPTPWRRNNSSNEFGPAGSINALILMILSSGTVRHSSENLRVSASIRHPDHCLPMRLYVLLQCFPSHAANSTKNPFGI